MAKKVGFGLITTPTGHAPWGTYSGMGADIGEDKRLQKHAKIGGDQQRTNSCVWWSIANAVLIILLESGLPAIWASVLAGYYATRMRTNGGDRNKLLDLGCYPTDSVMVLREVGIILDNKWPFNPANTNKEPDYGALISAKSDWIWMRRIVAPYGKVGENIRHIITKLRRPVLSGQHVDEAYLDWKPGDAPWIMSGKAEGRHMEAMDSYVPEGGLAISSWGDRYRRTISWQQIEDPKSEYWYPEIDIDKAREMLIGVKS